MNFDLHIIGSRDGYEKYPHDGLDEELKHCAGLHKACETLVVSTEMNIVHYVFFYSVGDDGSKDYIGFSLSFNGIRFHNIREAFAVMEQIFETAVYEGLFVHISDIGQVVFNKKSFYEQRSHHSRLEREAGRILSSVENDMTKLLPYYRVEDVDAFANVTDSEDIISERMSHYKRVAVSKDSTVAGLNDVKVRIERLHKQCLVWERKYNEERRKRKQYSLVIILFLIIITGGLVATYIIQGNNYTIGNLKRTVLVNDKKIVDKDGAIMFLNNQLDSVRMLNDRRADSIYFLKNTVRNDKKIIEEYEATITNMQNRLYSLQNDKLKVLLNRNSNDED